MAGTATAGWPTAGIVSSMRPLSLGLIFTVVHGDVVMISEVWHAERYQVQRIHGVWFHALAWSESLLLANDGDERRFNPAFWRRD